MTDFYPHKCAGVTVAMNRPDGNYLVLTKPVAVLGLKHFKLLVLPFLNMVIHLCFNTAIKGQTIVPD